MADMQVQVTFADQVCNTVMVDAREYAKLLQIKAAAKILIDARGRYNTEAAFNSLKESLK